MCRDGVESEILFFMVICVEIKETVIKELKEDVVIGNLYSYLDNPEDVQSANAPKFRNGLNRLT